MTLAQVIECIRSNQLLKKYHLKRIGIFGSIIQSDDPHDIDILIDEFEDYRDLLRLKADIRSLCRKRVDIVIAKHTSPIKLYRAKKEIRYVA